MHVSIPVENSVEIVESTKVTPFAYKCKVKVLYVGHNRNGTFFDKQRATEMGQSLKGLPIVGLYNAEKKDFEEHSREMGYDPIDKKYKAIDLTRPYGFVPTDAQIWFQKFQDDDGEIREYLCTECYIWNKIYPESQRIIDQGNNQSMELDEENFNGNWAEDFNTHARFFIVSEALVKKLCILGEDQEPCFQGAQIKPTFSLHDEFESLKQTMYTLMQELTQQGGLNNPMNENENNTANLENQNPETEFKKNPDEDKENKEGKENKENTSENKENTEGSKKEENEDKDKDKKKKYNLDEVTEYQTLKSEHATLQRQYAALQQEKNDLVAEIEPLRVFKAQAEKAKKEAMVNSFYMLSDEDKADVVKNMDTYSLEEIESKLAVIGMRNKVNFGLSQEPEKEHTPSNEENTLLFNLQSAANQNNEFNGIPAWIQAVQETEKNL